MENLLLLLIWLLIPVVTITPALLATGWLVHRGVKRKQQRVFALISCPMLFLVWAIVFTEVPGHSLWEILLKGASMGICGGPALALYFSDRWPETSLASSSGPIGSLVS